MEALIGPVVSILTAVVSGIVVSIIALFRSQHKQEIAVHEAIAKIREDFRDSYVKTDALNSVMRDIRGEIKFIKGILVPVAQRLSIPTALDHDD